MGRILVADDHDSLRRGIVRALSDAHHEVEEAPNGAQTRYDLPEMPRLERWISRRVALKVLALRMCIEECVSPANRDLPRLDEDTKLTELGLDSTGVLEMLIELEQHASFEVDVDTLDPEVFATVRSLTDYVMQMTPVR